jgi:branched-chain amino acid transport system permease protein
MVQQILINGVLTSGIYALLAIGFSLIFGVARIVNLAHTAFYMLAAYFIFLFAHLLGLNVLLSIALAIFLTTLIGMVTYKLCIDPIREHETSIVIVTVSLAIALQEIILLFFKGDFLSPSPFVSGYVELLKVRISWQHLLTLGAIFILLLGMWVLLFKSKLGVSMRVTAQDREIANLMGINVGRICLITMGMAVLLAAIGGVMIAPISILEPHLWGEPLVIVIAVVVLGGLGSTKGSVIGAFILGFTETLVVFIIPGGGFIKGAVALMIVVFILWFRPEGLFGVVFEEERL